MGIAALETSLGVSVAATAKTWLIFERARRMTARCRGPQPSNSQTGTFTSSPADDGLEHGQQPAGRERLRAMHVKAGLQCPGPVTLRDPCSGCDQQHIAAQDARANPT